MENIALLAVLYKEKFRFVFVQYTDISLVEIQILKKYARVKEWIQEYHTEPPVPDSAEVNMKKYRCVKVWIPGNQTESPVPAGSEVQQEGGQAD
jgi:hypothetical protein